MLVFHPAKQITHTYKNQRGKLTIIIFVHLQPFISEKCKNNLQEARNASSNSVEEKKDLKTK